MVNGVNVPLGLPIFSFFDVLCKDNNGKIVEDAGKIYELLKKCHSGCWNEITEGKDVQLITFSFK